MGFFNTRPSRTHMLALDVQTSLLPFARAHVASPPSCLLACQGATRAQLAAEAWFMRKIAAKAWFVQSLPHRHGSLVAFNAHR